MQWANALTTDDLVAMAKEALMDTARVPTGKDRALPSEQAGLRFSKPGNQSADDTTSRYIRLQQRNKEVNADIRRWSESALPSHTVLDLGHPSAALKSAGFPDLPIHLTQSVLAQAITKKHEVDVADLLDLTLNVQYPMAVFASKKGDDHRVLLTRMRHRDGNIVVAVALCKSRDEIAVNDISSVHPKQDYKIAHWLDSGLLLGYEKTKGRAWLEDSAASNSRQPQAIMATLDRATVYEEPKHVNATDIRYSRSPANDPESVFADIDKITNSQGPWQLQAKKSPTAGIR